jgi:DNA (cytosine-5)-methyltransferase 1
LDQGEDLRLLDLCCGAGGAAKGYQAAGFEVVGVDIAPRPTYPGAFIQADAIEYALEHIHEFDAVHGSPPCQDKCTLNQGTNKARGFIYPKLYKPMRDVFEMAGIPAVIENPESRPDVMLCGEMFSLGVLRHRKFELHHWSMAKPKHVKHRGRVRGYRHGQWYDGPYIAAYGSGGGKGNVQEMQKAMGIDWTEDHHELTEAIPPAYTKFIGDALMAHLLAQKEAA